jgi:hypothetical protein
MTRIRIALLLSSIFAAPVLAADVSGSWNRTFKADWTTIPDLACLLSQKDQRLEGTCRDATGRTDDGVQLTDGRINADQVSWSWKILVAPTGVTWTWVFTGKLDADGSAIQGVVMLSAGPGSKQNEVSFTATKQ